MEHVWVRNMVRTIRFLAAFPFLLSLLCGQTTTKTAGAPVDFQRQVRPILSDNCFLCHGPDKETRMAGLRLDTHEGILEKRKNGAPVVPGSPDESLILQRVFADKPARRMPPPYSHRTLTEAQKDVLKRWIEQGAVWKDHWAFAAPVKHPLPDVHDAQWVRNPIDRFILARLDAAHLQPAPEAPRSTLIRRLSLDLTGLPPTPEEVYAFENDKLPDAYEKLVDKYLASPHYGEHRAKAWLDAARYADTHGIHVDNYREMWPYRDWVINAFNRNLSFDRFTVEQIAGDLLPNPTLDQLIATGFHRCNVTTNEAGIIPEEFQAIYDKDRVDTTGAVWLGLTIGCATCHDHKFDPILQKDFYSMGAFFKNTTQPVMDGNIPDTPPIVVVPRTEDRDRWARLIADEASMRKRMKQEVAADSAEFSEWLNSPERRAVSMPIGESAQVRALELNGEVKWGGKPVKLSKVVTFGEGPENGRKALHFGKDSSLALPNMEFDADKPFSISAWIYYPKNDDSVVIASQADTKDKGRGWSINVGGRVPGLSLRGDNGKAITVRAGHLEQLQIGTWNHLVVTYDGTREVAGMNMYVNGEAVNAQGGDEIRVLKGSIATKAPLLLGGEGKRHFEGGAIADFRVFNRALNADEARMTARWPVLENARHKGSADLTAQEKETFHLYYLLHKDQGYRDLLQQMAKVALEKRDVRKRGAITLVMQERTDAKPIGHVLYRGQYDQPREAVEPNVPAVLPPMPASYPKNRLGLAKWLVDDSNPLTARVTVNRFWQEVFGTGIVKTAEDFGSQGEAPSHPQLLDWLAVDFRESGWDVKRLFKLIVTSSTYRQAALADKDKLEKDPDNRLLSRGARYRMDGEMVRDYALAVSGLLVPTIGGPSVKPYQPPGVWEAVAMEGSNTRHYRQDHADRLYRRSLYTFWKRSAPPASMDIFNAPTREACTVRRERTNTPLQALVAMNDPQFVEAARRLAENSLRAAPGNLDREFDFLSWRLLARPFFQQEREVAHTEYKDYLNYYDSHLTDAKKLVSVGESKTIENLSPAEVAAMTMLANQVMNLDEVLTK